MPQGDTEVVNSRIIPSPYPNMPSGLEPHMHDMVINGTTYTFDNFTEESIVVTSGPFTFSIGYWGFVEIFWDTADANLMPGNGQTSTVLTISQYRVATPRDGTRISPAFPSKPIKIKGQTPATDTTPPTVLSVLPAGINEELNAPILINFSEDIQIGTGNFYIYNATTNNLVETIPVASAVLTNDTQINLAPVVTQSNSTSYSVRWDAGVVKDLANNNVAVNTTNTYAWITKAASGGGGGNPGDPTADIIVSSYSELIAQLNAWQNNWNATTPSGKTNSDDRVVGINAITSGRWSITGYNFPQRVYIRHIGTYTPDMKCSVYHTYSASSATGTNAPSLFANNTNLWFYLMDFRSFNTTSPTNHQFDVDNNTNCGIVRCALRGFEITPVFPVVCITSYFMNSTGSTDFIFKNNAYFFYKDGPAKYFGTHTRLLHEGNTGDWIGGDDVTVGSDGLFIDCISRCNYFARNRAMTPGNHNDCWQFNKANASGPGAKATRWFQEYDVALRGVWIGPTANQGGESGWGVNWLAGAGIASTGPHYIHDCLFVSGHNRAFTSFLGGGTTVEFCSAIQHDNSQPPNKAYPAITGTSVSNRNFVCANNSGYTTQQGTGGLKLILGGLVTGIGANYSLLLPYCTNIPTNTTDLWDIRPPSGAITHPNHSTPGNRIGCFNLWQKLFNGDSDVVLSKVGWPVSPVWRTNYDVGGNFYNKGNGPFDADGNNI